MKFEPRSISEQVRQISRFSRILTIHGIKHWIDFGTLLGAVRHGGLIPGDFDVDFDILATDRGNVMALRKQVLEDCDLLLIDAPVLRCCPVHEGMSQLQNESELLSSCRSRGLLYVDLYTCMLDGFEMLHLVKPFQFKAFFVDGLETISFEGFTFPCPRHSEDLLYHRYGPTWKTPIDESVYRPKEFEYVVPFRSPIVACFISTGLINENDLTLLQHARKLFEKVSVGRLGACPLLPIPKLQEEQMRLLLATGLIDQIIEDFPLNVDLGFLEQHGIRYILARKGLFPRSVTLADNIAQRIHEVDIVAWPQQP